MKARRVSSVRHTLLGSVFGGAMAVALTSPALAGTETMVQVQRQAGTAVDGGNDSQIIGRNGLDRNTIPPGGILDDAGVNGIGQMRTITGTTRVASDPPGVLRRVGGTCTGTLINPRAVIFAAHCVNAQPMSAYGSGGTIPLSFGFGADNLFARTQWAGTDLAGRIVETDPAKLFKTNVDNLIYTANQVWYDPRSLPTGFLEADIAIATLDTPANNVPTWMMLFSPLTGPTRATITGYGNSGTSATSGANVALDSRRRVAENMIDFLGSLDDKNDLIFGPANRTGVSSLYQLDFDDPDPNRFAAFNPSLGRFDFDHFGGITLEREGTTAGGDSGGPLIVTIGGKRVTTATLSGGSQVGFTNPVPGGPALFPGFSTYSTTSFYQPLFLYWDVIIANNPYVYATNKGGDGRWLDPAHWVQTMDPNYVIEVDGQLDNALPSVAAQGQAIDTPGFGVVSFLGTVLGAAGNTPNTTPAQFVPGGPGTENFVANNEDGNRLTGRRASYYNVTLSAAGNTVLDGPATIDEMKLDGSTRLTVAGNGSLRVLGEFNNVAGATHVDGLIRSGEATLVTGLLSGNGTFDPTFLTSIAGVIAPGSLTGTGTLTIKGDVVFASASMLVLDINRNAQDKLVITGDAQNAGQILLGGTLFFQKNADTPAPRHGQTFDIVTATGGVQGTFDNVATLQGIGVLRPELAYGANAVSVNIRAGSVREYIGPAAGGTAIAFAQALDTLRLNSYNNLYGLYGAIDLMDGVSLARTLSNLAPTGIARESFALQDTQSRVLLGTIGDRLSALGSGRGAGTLSVVGAPRAALGFADGRTTDVMAGSGIAGLTGEQALRGLPEGFSGFVSGGFTSEGSAAGATRSGLAGRHSRHFAMGLEMPMGENLTIGTAFGQANGYAMPGAAERTEAKTTQVAVYGSYRLGGGAYVAGLAAAERSRTGLDRSVFDGDGLTALTGATRAARYSAMVEGGVNLPLGNGLTVTPRASLGYAVNQLDGFRENGGEVALRLSDVSLKRVEAKLGAQLAGSASLGGGWSFVPQIAADMVQNVGGNEAGMQVRFAAAPEHRFLLPLAGGDERWGEVSGAFKLSKGRMEFGAGIESSIGRSDFRDERALASFAVRF